MMGRAGSDLSASPTLGFLNSLTTDNQSPFKSDNLVSPLKSGDLMSPCDNFFYNDLMDRKSGNGMAMRFSGGMTNSPGMMQPPLPVTMGPTGQMPNFKPMPDSLSSLNIPPAAPNAFAANNANTTTLSATANAQMQNTNSIDPDAQAKIHLQQLQFLQAQHQLQQSQQTQPCAKDAAMAQSVAQLKSEQDFEDGEEFDADAAARAKRSAGAVNAARARRRINESFKHLADLCACSRSKKPSILISAIEKIRRLETQVRTLESNAKQQNADREVMNRDLRADSFLPSAPENVTAAAIIRSIAQLSRVPTTLAAGKCDWSQDYQHVFDTGNMAMLILGTSSKIVAINKPCSKLLGFSQQEVLAEHMTVYEITHEASIQDTLIIGSGLFAKPHVLHRFNKSYLHKDGHAVRTLTTTWVSFSKQGKMKWCHVVIEPISLPPGQTPTVHMITEAMPKATLDPPMPSLVQQHQGDYNI